jgi:hypothetical protein
MHAGMDEQLETDVDAGAARTRPGRPPDSVPGDPTPGDVPGTRVPNTKHPAPGTSEESQPVTGVSVPRK